MEYSNHYEEHPALSPPKSQFSPHVEEFSSPSSYSSPKRRGMRVTSTTHLGLTVLAFFVGIVILVLSAHAIAVFNDTYLGADFLLPLWPGTFNLGPSIAVLVCGGVVIVSALGVVVASKVPAVCLLNSLHIHSLPVDYGSLFSLLDPLFRRLYCRCHPSPTLGPCGSHYGHGVLLRCQHVAYS
jgi:hypothetical protein